MMMGILQEIQLCRKAHESRGINDKEPDGNVWGEAVSVKGIIKCKGPEVRIIWANPGKERGRVWL